VRCFAVPLRYSRPAQDAISVSVPVARLTADREAGLIEALCAVGDKVSRVLRPVAEKVNS
jgi:DNA-binding IclR family transcriptional regulator